VGAEHLGARVATLFTNGTVFGWISSGEIIATPEVTAMALGAELFALSLFSARRLGRAEERRRATQARRRNVS
jgi:hypothetical protein